MRRFISLGLAAMAIAQLVLSPGLAAMAADTPSLAAGARIYLSLDDTVSSARGGDDVGTIVRCHVWRDVEDQGVLFIKSGTPATCNVSKVSRRNMGGFEGHVAIAGLETQAVDGQTVTLAGGYNKEGSGHKAVVLLIGIFLLWPVLFVPGGNAELPPGTVFDVTTVNDLRLSATAVAAAPPLVDLRGLANQGFTAEFMLDDFLKQPKHDVFRIKVAKDGPLPPSLVIDNVDGKSIDAIPLALKDSITTGDQTSAVAEVDPKLLAKYFVRGINRFEVAYTEDGQRKATEVIMNVQM
jgi:hypothetical protein